VLRRDQEYATGLKVFAASSSRISLQEFCSFNYFVLLTSSQVAPLGLYFGPYFCDFGFGA
jgi:hypothetical protein